MTTSTVPGGTPPDGTTGPVLARWDDVVISYDEDGTRMIPCRTDDDRLIGVVLDAEHSETLALMLTDYQLYDGDDEAETLTPGTACDTGREHVGALITTSAAYHCRVCHGHYSVDVPSGVTAPDTTAHQRCPGPDASALLGDPY
ncbi:hypothetical protein ACFWPV_09970 [Streptomyces uncialis]|uniref:hypothetical protein n=1 Tax=Streptomyces uncialis TaxID=1048205 RepID=UPI00364C75DC